VERLFAGRYRLGSVVYRSKSAVVHDATHRNSTPSWVKVALRPADAAGIELEANIANRIPSAERVRDDGVTEEGAPYLVLEPIDGLPLHAVLEETHVTIPIAQLLGEDLAFVLSALHVAGYALGGFDVDDVFCARANGIVLFALDRAIQKTPEAVFADVLAIANIVDRALSKAEPESSFAFVVERAKSGRYDSVDAFLREWQAAANGSGKSVRPRAPSLPVAPPLSSVAPAPPPSRPSTEARPAYERSDVLDLPYDTERSMSVVTGPPSTRLSSPLMSVPEFPRHVMSSMTSEAQASSSWSGAAIAGISGALVLFVAGAIVLSRDDERPPPVPKAAAIAVIAPADGAENKPTITAPPSPPPPAAPAVGRLRTEGGPKRNVVYVDGEAVGKTPLDAEVACGPRLVRIGVAKTNEIVDIPCGGTRVARFIVDGPRLRWSFGDP
jgi:hypothetical protein